MRIHVVFFLLFFEFSNEVSVVHINSFEGRKRLIYSLSIVMELSENIFFHLNIPDRQNKIANSNRCRIV